MTQHVPTEDVPYNNGDIDPFAIADETDDDSVEEQELTVETIVIREIRAYIKSAIKEHNSFDVLTIPANAEPKQKIAVFDEMFNHKGLVHHLRQIEQIINNKVKEN